MFVIFIAWRLMKSWLSWIFSPLQIVVLQNRQPVHTFHVDNFEPVSVALHPGETEFAVGSGTVGLPFGILTHWPLGYLNENLDE